MYLWYTHSAPSQLSLYRSNGQVLHAYLESLFWSLNRSMPHERRMAPKNHPCSGFPPSLAFPLITWSCSALLNIPHLTSCQTNTGTGNGIKSFATRSSQIRRILIQRQLPGPSFIARRLGALPSIRISLLIPCSEKRSNYFSWSITGSRVQVCFFHKISCFR